jgi:hypothetical protein
MECDHASAGYETIVTPFLYPDRDNIEVFIRELDDGRIFISDLGQTMMKLSAYGFTPAANTPRRRAMIFQIVSSMNVQYERGEIVVTTNTIDSGARLWDVVMAVQRLSDLVYTVPGYTKATFADEFEGFAAQLPTHYERGVLITLPDHQFTADFVIDRKVIQLVSAGSPGYAQERVNRVYTNFAEMNRTKDERQKFAVIDDREPTVDSHLRNLLTHQADRVLVWTRRNELERVLTAVA